MAWPVPTATTFTSIPLALLNSGRRWTNSPDCSVDVVEAIRMLGVFAIENVAINAIGISVKALKSW